MVHILSTDILQKLLCEVAGAGGGRRGRGARGVVPRALLLLPLGRLDLVARHRVDDGEELLEFRLRGGGV